MWIIGNIDFITESGSNDVYINEINTNVGLYGTYTQQVDSVNLVSDYANEKGCTTAYIYGQVMMVQKQIHQHYNNQ